MVEEKRERWNARGSFIMAAIGSAVGLGNIWRFPYIAYKNGGGAFLIPYFIALFTAGIPLVILEYSLGQYMQGAAPKAMKKVKKSFEFIGWWALGIGSIISFYYCVVMAWSWKYLLASFNMEWGENTKDYFFNKVLHISKGPFEIGGIQWEVLIGLALTWVLIYFIIYKGVNRVGKVVNITVPLPIIMLIILFIRGITLPGALKGINYYLEPNFAILLDWRVWLEAYSQIFFSLSLGFGIMIAYASYMPKESDVANNAFIMSLANCATSFFGGFAVFSILGYLSVMNNIDITKLKLSGPGLAFVTYPLALYKLPALGALFSIAFFVMLLTLGIDSAFSIVEAIVSGIHDKWNINKEKLTLIFCIVGFLSGIIFTTGSGLYWLDIVDHWMSNFGLGIIGLLECILLYYFFDFKKIKEYINSVSEIKVGLWWDICIGFITPAILGFSLIFNFNQEFTKSYESYPMKALLIGGWGIAVLCMIFGIFMMKMKGNRVKG